MSSSIVDIIVPNYNKGKYLEECINSILDQTFINWTLYLIDDCSNDNSKIILDKYKNKKQINIIELKKNKGPSFCRNLGMRLSNSKYLSFLDSDDIWTKNKLKEQINFMTEYHHNFTYSDYTPFIIRNNKYVYKKGTKLKMKFSYEDFIHNSSINSSTMIISRKILGTNKFKKLELLEDYLFKCDILKKNHLAMKFDKNLAYYRILPNNRSSSKLKNIFNLWKINNKYNRLNFLKNFKSLIGIIFNSIKKYGIK